MARTLAIAFEEVEPGTITRSLLNTTTAASAVIAKILVSSGISIAFTGVDSGTGDVTLGLGNITPTGANISANGANNTFNSIAANLQVKGTTNAGASESLQEFSADALGPTLQFFKSRNATIDSYTVVTSGDVLGKLDFLGVASTTTNRPSAASFQVVTDGSPNASFVPTRFEWYTSTGTAASALAMKLDSSKNLTVTGNVASNQLLLTSQTSPGGTPAAGTVYFDSTKGRLYAADGSFTYRQYITDGDLTSGNYIGVFGALSSTTSIIAGTSGSVLSSLTIGGFAQFGNGVQVNQGSLLIAVATNGSGNRTQDLTTIVGYRSNSAVLGTGHAALASNDIIFGIGASGTTGSTDVEGGYIQWVADTAWTTSTSATRLEFYTSASGSITPTLGMTLDNAKTLTLTGLIKINTSHSSPGTATSGQTFLFNSSTAGTVLYGFGSSQDVTLANRAGTAALTITANSTQLNAAANLICGTYIQASGNTSVTSIGSGAAIAYNVGGIGETDFYNNNGGSAGGWNFNNGTGGTFTTLVKLDSSGGLELASIAAAIPTTADSGFARLNVRTVGGRKMFGQIDDTGQHTPFQPHFGRNQIIQWDVQAGSSVTATLLTTLGYSLNVTGTPTVNTVQSSSTVVGRLMRADITSAASAGSILYMRNSGSTDGGVCTLGSTGFTGIGGFTAIFRFAIRDVTNASAGRMFVGLRGGNTTGGSAVVPTNVDPAGLLNQVGIAQISTDNTQLYIVYGGTTAQTAIGLGTNFPAASTSGAVFELALYSPENSNNTVFYQVSRIDNTSITPATGTLTGTAGTVLPANTIFLSPVLWRTNNTATTAVVLGFISMYVETDN